MRQVAWVGGASLVCALGCASAQDFKAAQSCVRLGDDAARLACYDAALGAAKIAGFGDNGQLHPDAQADLPKTMIAQVKQATALAHGLYLLALDNGQVWRTTQADSALEFKTHDQVVLARRVLGGYEISFAGRNASVNATRIK
jgi:hypothetical protein